MASLTQRNHACRSYPVHVLPNHVLPCLPHDAWYWLATPQLTTRCEACLDVVLSEVAREAARRNSSTHITEELLHVRRCWTTCSKMLELLEDSNQSSELA